MSEPMLPAYFHDAEDGHGIESSSPEPMTLEQALRVFRGLHSPDSFIGFCLPEGLLLQMVMGEDLLFHVEHMKEGASEARRCELNAPLAERVIRAAFEGQPIEPALAEFPVQWKTEQLYP
jgi:hypothetical protein